MSIENLRAITGVWLDCMHKGVRLDSDKGDKECMSFDGARVEFDGSRGVVPNIPVRGFNLAYAVREFLWYCGGDRFDHSIVERAKIWQKFIQPDGGINSNYGQYMFKAYDTFVGFKLASLSIATKSCCTTPIPVVRLWCY